MENLLFIFFTSHFNIVNFFRTFVKFSNSPSASARTVTILKFIKELIHMTKRIKYDITKLYPSCSTCDNYGIRHMIITNSENSYQRCSKDDLTSAIAKSK